MKPIAEQSFYEILEIPQDAQVVDIEKAYQRAKALYGPGSLATYSLVAPEEMALLNRLIEEARRVLLDAGARAGYDATLPDAPGRAVVPRPAAPPPAEPPAASASAAAPPGIPAQPIPAVEATPEAAAARGAVVPPAGAEATAPPAETAAAPPARPAEAAAASPSPASPTQPAPQAAPAAAPVAPAAAPVAPAAKPPGFSAPEGTAWTGEMLRQAREGRGLTLHQVAERTKVARHHLENIEADRYQLLPPPVYLRGILVSLAKELRLDPQKVSRSYLAAVQAAEAEKAPPKPR